MLARALWCFYLPIYNPPLPSWVAAMKPTPVYIPGVACWCQSGGMWALPLRNCGCGFLSFWGQSEESDQGLAFVSSCWNSLRLEWPPGWCLSRAFSGIYHLKPSGSGKTGGQAAERVYILGRKRLKYMGKGGLWKAPGYTVETRRQCASPGLEVCSEKTWEDP